METQLTSLQTSCEELGAQRKTSEKKDKENNKLKLIISSQDENVSHTHLHTIPIYYSGTSDKGPSEIGTTSLQRTFVAAPC